MSFKIIKHFFCFSLFFIFSCGKYNQVLEYHDNKGYISNLNSQNHPTGFGKGQCFTCHQKFSLHISDRYNTSLVQSARDNVEQDGLSSCNVCHGYNGYNP